MERLRSKAGQYKSWMEMSKSLRLAITEKRHLVNSGERSQLQKVLDILQKSIKVTSLQSMVERLDSITRQQGLKFSSGTPNTECYIFSDMFYVEIVLETTGAVKDVKIAHQGEPMSTTCPELVKVLKAENFTEFTKHLEGLASIYQLNTEKKQKSKAYLALQALEVDLSMLAQLQSSINDPSNFVHRSPVGILQQRRGGYSLKLTYFISPYDLLDPETKTSIPFTVDAVTEKGLGHSVTVCIESSTAHKLQTTSLISVSKTPEGKSLPSFAALSNLNSTTLPANFVLKLPKPIPIATSLVKKIQNVTSAKLTDYADLSSAQPLLNVIINDASNGKITAADQGLCVTLPDQHHCYFLNSNPGLQGVMISSIPFTHPTHVPQILVFLRQQMLFNTVISSCVRPGSKKDAESPFMFEVMAYSTSHILVSFEHPLEESLATVDLDLKDITNAKCKIYTLSSDATMCTDEYASKIMQRCLSIPITMRAVIRKAQGQQQLLRSSNQSDMYCATVSNSGPVSYLSHIPNYGNSLTNGSSFTGGDFSNLASRMCNKPSDGNDLGSFAKNISNSQNSDNPSFNHSNSSVLNSDNSNMEGDVTSSSNSGNRDGFLERTKNSHGLDVQNGNSSASNQYQQKRHANTMLMNMLSDVPSANPSSTSFPFLGQNDNSSIGSKSRKRKRKDNRGSGSSTGRSPKRKLSEDDCGIDRSTPDLEMRDSPLGFDASSLPASFPSSTDQHLNRNCNSIDFLKTEPPSPSFPQRSASTDSYLMHEDFQSRQVLNISDSSRMSEGGIPNSTEHFRNLSQAKNQYFGSDNVIEFNKGFLSNADPNYGDPGNSDVDIDDDSSFIESNQPISHSSKFSSGEKPAKKKKSKERNELISESNDLISSKNLDNSSDESSIGDVSQKSFSETENSQSEDSSATISKSSSAHSSQPIFISTSLKIAKSGDGHKISKSELKIKQKEGKKTSSSSESSEGSGKRKSDAKKERKRRKAENADNVSGRSPVRSIHLNIDSSLMPPPSSSSETNPLVSSSDTQPIRPITLNVKASPIVTSNSNFQSKSPVHKKSSSVSNVGSSFSKSGNSKNSSSEKGVKPSPPRSSHVSSIKVNSSDSDSKRGSSSTTVKIQSKHKQSSSSKTNSSGSGSVHSSGRSSPSKAKSATLKLKNFTLPSSITLTPIVSKATISSPTSTHMSIVTASDPLIMQAAILNPGSPGKNSSNSSKANKSALRSRKSSLSAVIDKLRVTATNAQHILPDGMDNPKYDNARSESITDRKESKLDRKDNNKESRDGISVSKSSESKSKFSSSDQFTVKQSSQGIKLTVTKTRSSEGSSKSKSKQSTKSSSVSSSSVGKATNSSGNVSKSGPVTAASKKVYSSSSGVNLSTKLTNVGGNQTKSNISPSHKISSPSSLSSSLSPRTSSSANNLSKSVSKHVSSSQNKVSASGVKALEKGDKKPVLLTDPKVICNEIKDKVSTSSVNIATSLMLPPPLSNKSVSDMSRSSSGSTPKRIDEGSSQSPRHTPTRETSADESDGERAFRILLNQQKSDSSNGSEPNILPSKSCNFLSSAVDYSKIDVLKKSESEDKSQWVSSSSDVKSSNLQRSSMKMNPDQIMDESSCLGMNEVDCKPSTCNQLLSQIEVSSSSKHDTLNTNVVSSSEEITKTALPVSKSVKQLKRPNGPNDKDSSPEDCLVIDYPDDNSRHQISSEEKWSSPCVDSSIVLNALDEKIDKSEMSPSTFAVNHPSLTKSPAQVMTPNHSLPIPLSLIDDELMNEAVMPIEK
ncbi:mediator of RNA polymerase II transcription subunit 1-like [Uloborus diversus]|uniref:mediator of RNA polymerase II transcription subunit 1-like n=1 Tax=Uloborus diversus TaxID=327109 RepID=UPI0024099CA9|nr:mediator of RNA polymerase II transcription subunit 1-like [Uloborus diversus]